MMVFDRRITPVRHQVAAIHLKGCVEAEHYVEGARHQVSVPIAPVFEEPKSGALRETELLFGEFFIVYGSEGDWVWGQSETDEYVGWIEADCLSTTRFVPTHMVSVASALVFPRADIKAPPTSVLSMGSLVSVSGSSIGKGTSRPLAALAEGDFIPAHQVKPLNSPDADFVSFAEQFLNVPYLWGGRSNRGLDCTALIQIALGAAGVKAPRDSDMQAAQLGRTLPARSRKKLRRGDLVYWRGHSGIMQDSKMLLHANAYSMAVASEPLNETVARISKEYGSEPEFRRL